MDRKLGNSSASPRGWAPWALTLLLLAMGCQGQPAEQPPVLRLLLTVPDLSAEEIDRHVVEPLGELLVERPAAQGILAESDDGQAVLLIYGPTGGDPLEFGRRVESLLQELLTTLPAENRPGITLTAIAPEEIPPPREPERVMHVQVDVQSEQAKQLGLEVAQVEARVNRWLAEHPAPHDQPALAELRELTLAAPKGKVPLEQVAEFRLIARERPIVRQFGRLPQAATMSDEGQK